MVPRIALQQNSESRRRIPSSTIAHSRHRQRARRIRRANAYYRTQVHCTTTRTAALPRYPDADRKRVSALSHTSATRPKMYRNSSRCRRALRIGCHEVACTTLLVVSSRLRSTAPGSGRVAQVKVDPPPLHVPRAYQNTLDALSRGARIVKWMYLAMVHSILSICMVNAHVLRDSSRSATLV